MNNTPGNALQPLLAQERWAFRLALALVRDPARAEDLVQTAFEAAIRRPPSKDVPARRWLAKTLRNRARFEERSTRTRLETWTEKARQLDSEQSADHALCVLEQRQMLLSAVTQ